MILKAPAKLNLYLEVLNLRKDNYHNIKTIFSRINLADKIILREIKEDKIKIISPPFLPQDENNLCFKAAKLIKDYCRIKKGVEIKIIKNIPVGAGLGGGSSDAGAVFLGLNKLWRLNLREEELINFANSLGSDVIFFLYNYSFGLGIGKPDYIEPIKELENKKFWYVLVVPKINVQTSFIYSQFDKLKGFKLTKPKFDVNILIWGLKERDQILLRAGIFNHLEKITFRFYPQIEKIKEKFCSLGVPALMSGSGCSVFGIFLKRKEAELVCRYLKKDLKEAKIYLVWNN